MSKIQKNYKEEFIKSLECNDPKDLMKIWYNRSNDNFYFILEKLKRLTDTFFELETNPLIYVMMAYCFDGEKYKTVEKVRSIIAPLVLSDENDSDEIINTFVTLEESSENDYTTTLININDELPISSQYNLLLSGFDEDYGIIGKNLRVIRNENSLRFLFDAYADKDDIKWIKDTLFVKNSETNSFITRHLTISLQNKFNESIYNLIYLTDSTPIKYSENDNDDILTIEFVCDQYYFCTESDNEIIENIKNNIKCLLENIDTNKKDINWPPLTEKNVSINIADINGLSFRLSGYNNDDCIHFYRLNFECTENNSLMFTISNICNDNIDSYNRLIETYKNINDMTINKKDIVKDMKIKLYDSNKNELLQIADIKNAYITYIDENKLNVVFDTVFINASDDDQVANYIRKQISLLVSDTYRTMRNEYTI